MKPPRDARPTDGFNSARIGPQCFSMGKRSFLTRADAKLAKAHMKAWGKGSDHLQVFKCPDCGNFHLGSRLSQRQFTREDHRRVHGQA